MIKLAIALVALLALGSAVVAQTAVPSKPTAGLRAYKHMAATGRRYTAARSTSVRPTGQRPIGQYGADPSYGPGTPLFRQLQREGRCVMDEGYGRFTYCDRW